MVEANFVGDYFWQDFQKDAYFRVGVLFYCLTQQIILEFVSMEKEVDISKTARQHIEIT